MRGLPITRCSTLRSAFTRCRCASVSPPLFVCGGVAGGRSSDFTGGTLRSHGGGPSAGPVHDLPGAAAGLAGSAGAGAVKAPIVGATNASALNEYPPGTAARGPPATTGIAVADGCSKGGGASRANTPQTTLL